MVDGNDAVTTSDCTALLQGAWGEGESQWRHIAQVSSTRILPGNRDTPHTKMSRRGDWSGMGRRKQGRRMRKAGVVRKACQSDTVRGWTQGARCAQPRWPARGYEEKGDSREAEPLYRELTLGCGWPPAVDRPRPEGRGDSHEVAQPKTRPSNLQKGSLAPFPGAPLTCRCPEWSWSRRWSA